MWEREGASEWVKGCVGGWVRVRECRRTVECVMEQREYGNSSRKRERGWESDKVNAGSQSERVSQSCEWTSVKTYYSFPIMPQEKRKLQTEVENKRRQLEDDRRTLQHLKVSGWSGDWSQTQTLTLTVQMFLCSSLRQWGNSGCWTEPPLLVQTRTKPRPGTWRPPSAGLTRTSYEPLSLPAPPLNTPPPPPPPPSPNLISVCWFQVGAGTGQSGDWNTHQCMDTNTLTTSTSSH